MLGSAIGSAAGGIASGVGGAASGIASGAGNLVGGLEGAAGGAFRDMKAPLSKNWVDPQTGKPATGAQGFASRMSGVQDAINDMPKKPNLPPVQGGTLADLDSNNLLNMAGPQGFTPNQVIDSLQRRAESAQDRNRQLKRKKVELGRKQ